MTGTPKLPSTFNSFVTKTKFFCRNKLSELISCTEMIEWTRKNYRIWFLSTSGISSCGISQGKIISVNWLLCYRFFLLGTPPSPFQHFNRQRQKTHTFSQQFSRNNLSLKFHAQVLTIVFVFVLQDRNRGLSLCQ